MPYTTNQLITGAYYSVGIVSRDFETISGSQASDGLQWLNEILAEKRVDDSMVPYETKFKFNAVSGQEMYFIPGLISIDTVTFFIDSVRYSLNFTKRNQYMGSARVEGISTLPYQWFFERAVGGGKLYLYFLPDQNYPIEINGIFELPSVKLNQDLLNNSNEVNLGSYTIFSDNISFQDKQLVINDVSIGGYYSSIGSFINYINSGAIPGVTANLDAFNNFILKSADQIRISTIGYPPIGTRFIHTVSYYFEYNLDSTYNNQNFGVGATLTANQPYATLYTNGRAGVGDTILIANQTDNVQNGEYVISNMGDNSTPWVLVRDSTYSKPSQIQHGDLAKLKDGNLVFVQTSNVNLIGYSAITFQRFYVLTFSNFSTIQGENYEIFNPGGFDQFYITYLRYALADRICAEFNYTTPDNVVRQLSKYESWINQKSRLLDLQMQKTSTLSRRSGYSYAQINIGKGWSPN